MGLAWLCSAALACGSNATGPGGGAEAGDEGANTSGAESESESAGETGGVTGGLPEPELCEVTDDCRDGFCVAVWDQAAGELLRPFACQLQCVGGAQANLVCADDAACCEGLECDELGLCVEPGSESGSETSGETGSP